MLVRSARSGDGREKKNRGGGKEADCKKEDGEEKTLKRLFA